MAETAVLPLAQKLGALSTDEAKYLSQLKPEVESLYTQLHMMKAALKDADAILYKSERAKEWVKQIRELAFQAEDAIDMFVYKVAAQNQPDNIVQKIIKFLKLLIESHQLRVNIEDIKGKLKRLFDERTSFDIKALGLFDIKPPPLVSTQAHQPEPIGIVGFDTEAEELAKLLMEKEPLKPFGVVSITGMGGLGKSTLARKIFNRDDVKRHFDCQAYVTISKNYSRCGVLCKIIKQVIPGLTGEEKRALALEKGEILEEKLSECLKKKKNYLLVLDDVWKKEDWDNLARTFHVPCDGQQYRVLLITREEDVARHADLNAYMYKIKVMDEKNSLRLFWKVFFRSQNDKYIEACLKTLNHLNKEMEYLAMDFVNKCDGLPLAIVVLASLLSEKEPRNYNEWKKVLDRVNWHQGTSNYEEVLSLSYTELPFHLKPCFLYFGLFPQDIEIERDRLIRLWVAEGFLEPRENLKMEDVGRECLRELMQRNLIQVGKWKSNGVPQSFIIHDLLLNLAISEAEEGNFLNISTPHKSLNCYRRVALHYKCGENNMPNASYHSSSTSSNLLRSLLCFTEISPSYCGRFKLLKVLDLEDAPGIESLPQEIGKLIFLKYLSLCRTTLKTLPPWIGNLYNLQTLNLVATMIDEYLPIEILKLDKLRHLLCFRIIPKWRFDDSITKSDIGINCGCYRRPRPPPPTRNLGDLGHLQTLWLQAGDWIEDGLEKLTDLRDLNIQGQHMEKFKEALSKALAKFVCLEVLALGEIGDGQIFLPSFSDHVYLYHINIAGCIRELPDLKNFPPNLTSLQLYGTQLHEDMMKTLEKLPQLKDLSLVQPYDGIVMKCSTRGFPKLESLSLQWFDWLKNWIVEEGAMPNLRILEISNLYRLKCIPNGLRHITTLQELTLAMPKEFLEKVKEGGEDWEKIKHVPSINSREVTRNSTTNIPGTSNPSTLTW